MADVTVGNGVWVYAVCSDLDEQNLPGPHGVDGEAPRVVRAADLSAVVGSVDLARFGEEGLRRDLNDLHRLEAIARAHHNVVDAAAQHRPVVPTRLATVYEDDRGVRAMLQRHRDRLVAALRRVEGRQEWGVKAYGVRGDQRSSRPADPGGRAREGAGTAYLRRRQAALSSREMLRRSTIEGAEALYALLSALAVAARRHRPQDPHLSGDPRWMVLNAAYLLDNGRVEAFGTAVTRSATAHPELAVELTGPWPPYSFAVLDDAREES